MSKVIIGGALLIVVLGGVWYATSSSNQESMTGDSAGQVVSESENTDTEERQFSGVGSFKELLLRGSSLTCDFTVTDEHGTTEGTAYIDGKNERYRMDGTGQWDGQSGTFGTIVDSEFMYWWSDTPEGKMGMKMPVTEADADASYDTAWETADNQEPISAEETVAYDCNRWSVDSAVFVPPQDVEFTDMAAMMGEMMQGMPEGFEMPEGFTVPQ